MTPERKAKIAMAAMGAMIERIKLETAVIKGDVVGIATHAKNLAQFQSQAYSVTHDGVSKSDHQRTVRIDAQGITPCDMQKMADAAFNAGNIRATIETGRPAL